MAATPDHDIVETLVYTSGLSLALHTSSGLRAEILPAGDGFPAAVICAANPAALPVPVSPSDAGEGHLKCGMQQVGCLPQTRMIARRQDGKVRQIT